MNTTDALQEVERLNDKVVDLVDKWQDEGNKLNFPQYEAAIKKLFPRVLVEKVTKRPFGFIIRAEDGRLHVKYTVRGVNVTRAHSFSDSTKAKRNCTANK